MELWLDILMDALIDSIKLFPFLLLTYLLMEYLEHKTSTKTRAWIRKAGRLGPIAGGVAGIFPQCGFSVAASNLYSGGWERWWQCFYRPLMRCFQSFYRKR